MPDAKPLMPETDADLQSIQQARHFAERAASAARALAALQQGGIDAILDAMHDAARPQEEAWARLAVEETGFGNVPDKILKNRFATVDLHRHIRPMKTVGILSTAADDRLVEIASPVGVVAAIVPSTNPTSTAIYKIFIALKAGNAIVVSPHPGAQACVLAVAETLAAAATAAGAPPDSILCMTSPTLEGTHELMRHPGIGVILATGGPGLVKAAYSSGKPAFGVGPGNVPAFVDRSADVAKAAGDIIDGKTFDNGVLCSSENAVVADEPIAGRLTQEMEARGARFLSAEETRRLSDLAVRHDGSLNTAIVGKAAADIARRAEIPVPEGTRCLVAPLAGVGRSHPLSREKLSPILAFYVEDGWEACCARVLEILRYGGMGHTMSIHAQDREVIMKFATTKPVFRICVNTPASVGAVGLTTALEPSMTLGCGALGGNITSDNIMPRHLINVKRLAFETRPFVRSAAAPPAVPATVASAPLSSTRWWVQPRLPRRADVRSEGRHAPDPALIRLRLKEALEKLPMPARKASLSPLPQAKAHASPAQGKARAASPDAVPFVSESDVRQALLEKRHIVVDRRTIITPSARDLGQEHDIFQQI